MTEFMRQPLAFAQELAPEWLTDLQKLGRAEWARAGLPQGKTEHWKYTSLDKLRREFHSAAARPPTAGDPPVALPRLGPRLVFFNGQFCERWSDAVLPEGLRVTRFCNAGDETAARIRARLGTLVDRSRHCFAALNDAVLVDGVFVEVARGARVKEPLHVIWLTRGEDRPSSLNQRLLVIAGAQSEAAVVEHFASIDSGAQLFTNGLTELDVGDGARLDHYRLQLEGPDSLHVGGVHARLSRDATLNSFHLGLGGALKRIDAVVEHAGPGAHAELNGIYLPRGEQHIDYHTCIEHTVPHCTTDEVFRGIIGDSASAVFNGRIHIHPQAQKTRAELSNRNLLTSPRAEVNCKPELEIYADDVQCAHGATVAQIDPLNLYYLRSRGIPRDEAEVMLSYGFVNELVEGVRCEALQAFLHPLLARHFARDPNLRRHLL